MQRGDDLVTRMAKNDAKNSWTLPIGLGFLRGFAAFLRSFWTNVSSSAMDRDSFMTSKRDLLENQEDPLKSLSISSLEVPYK